MEEQNILESIVKLLSQQIQSVIDDDPDFYGGYKIVLSVEQKFVKERDKVDPKCIFIVIKFLEGAKDNGQLQQPILINALGEQNAIDVCQRLLHEFSQKYSVAYPAQDVDNLVIKQSYSTPMMMQNFNKVGSGYRSLFYMSGTLFVGSNINLIKKITWKNGLDGNGYPIYEEIPFLSARIHYNAQVDPRSQYGSNDFTESAAIIRTLSLSLSVYNTTENFNKKVLNVMFGEATVDTEFEFTIEYKDTNISSKTVKMRLVTADDDQQLRAFPARALSFTM